MTLERGLSGHVPFFLSPMLTLAVTGGVACGKSAFCRLFLESCVAGAVEYFSCDEAVRTLLEDGEVVERLASMACALEVEAVRGGSLDREVFRELLFDNREFRGRVEEELHPRVLAMASQRHSQLDRSVKIFLVEVPLLYEVEFPLPRDVDLAVAASTSVQLRRLAEGRRLPPRTARRILESQMPIEKKISRAGLVVWNDGSLAALQSQVSHLAGRRATLFRP